MKMIFLHGLGQVPENWTSVIRNMKVESDIFCPNLADFPGEKEVNYENLYSAFSDYCMSLDEPIHLCGLSLGGILALQYAIENPDRVVSLALIGTQYVAPKKLLKFQNMIFRFMPDRIFRDMGFGKKDFIQLCESMLELDFRDELCLIKCPVLVACGEKDQANKKAALQMGKIIPHAKTAVLKGAGHEVNFDAPEKLGKLLTAFYNQYVSRVRME